MPEIDWTSFLGSHHRAHLIVVDIDRGEPGEAAAASQLLRRLMHAIEAVGNFAVAERETHLLAAVEEDRDADRLRRALGAVPGEATSDWSSVAHARLDRAAAKRIRELSG